MIHSEIKKLVIYAIENNLIDKSEYYYSINQLLFLLRLDSFVDDENEYSSVELHKTLDKILDYAVKNNLIPYDTVAKRDYFESKVINCICKRPKEIENQFKTLYKKSPKNATTWFYSYCKKINYIKEERIKKDIKFSSKSKYGNIEITINLSKPEKDPKDIANLKNKESKSYPKCMLCTTNQGYSGRDDFPSRDNLRIIPITLDNEEYFFQYSPYSYFNEHSIVLNDKHIPMKIDLSTFKKLVNFVDLFPHYMIGSNADLPIVGGSILDHDHFQAGRYTFPMFKAKDLFSFKLDKYTDINASVLKWPLSVLRLKSKNKNSIIEASGFILNKWIKYDDKKNNIISHTDNNRHNTITPILHKQDNIYVMDLVLRNNITSDEYPLGLFHPHEKYWNIKKENIGLIEVMGLAVLPGRLKKELNLVKEDILKNGSIVNPEIEKHKNWVNSFINKYSFNKNNIDEIINKEVGNTFAEILECCGVFKQNSNQESLNRFLNKLNS